MHLKRLEIQGFKSFAEKTELDFKEGITCIVGPNGSGKSNISDAVLWVLGEQSVKTLRGSKMQDVIFGGTSKRKPLGYAEVTIVFDNKDGRIPIEYSEVSVTRRMFRSGESEYYINKNSCRLKDIKELFMDTGVGKYGYSIIGQGRVDEILSTKPEDRRTVFEEAAGIVKYKTRKEEAEKKLKRTEENLVRIDDIVFELKNQLEPLKEQSNVAKQYLKLAQDLKNLEINVFIREIDRLKLQFDEVEKEKLYLTKSMNEKLEEKDIIKNRYRKIKNYIEKSEKDINTLQNNIFISKNKLGEEKNKLVIYDEKEKFNQKESRRLKEEIDKLDIQQFELITEKEEIEKECVEYSDKLAALEKNLDEKNKILKGLKENITLAEKRIEKEKANIIENYNIAADKKSEINSLNSFERNIDKRINQIEEEIKNIDIDSKQKKRDINEILLVKNNKKKEIDELNKRNEISIKKRDKIKEELSILYKQSNDNRKNLQGKTSNYKLLKSMEEDYDGFYKSVRNAMKACKDNEILGRGIIGVVADLLTVEEKYEKAIEIALGSSLQNVITETEEDAKKVINYLKKYKLGRVTFLPITAIKGTRFNLKAIDKKKLNIIGIASDLINYDKKYKNIFDYLLGRTLVVENINNGILVAKRFNHKVKIVTLDGDVLNPGGSMTGGSTGRNTRNILNRKSRIDKLSKNIEQLTSTQTILDKKILSFEVDLGDIEKDIFNKQEILQNTSIEMMKLENKIENLIYKNEKSNKDIEKYLNEIDSLRKEKREINSQKEKSKLQLQEIEKDNESIQENIKIIIKQFKEKKEKKEKLDNIITNLKITINSIDNKSNSKRERLEELINNYQFVVESISIKNKEKGKIDFSIKKIGEERKNTKIEIDDLQVVLEEYSKNLERLKEDKKTFMKDFYTEQENLNDIREELNILEKKINKIDIKQTKYSVQMENYNTKLLEDYDLSYKEALKYKTEIDDLVESRQMIKNLRSKVKKLGAVNLGAIEDYKRLKDRFSFMNEQREDLLAGKESLKEIIEEMENKMKEQFIFNLNKISKNFKQIFAELFGGGEADIYLEDEKNVLESGIEIVAQPPGKKPQSLSLLSGGEKSLTAVALLFAILKTKPTPFCILDEIDAALDEANINRYANYLKEFAKDTQFIIITHRKGTMEIGDVLHGITMEEEGVSKIVSIKLTDKHTEVAS